MFNLTEQYKRQSTWREWDRYIEKIPITKQDIILDFGCSIGSVTKLLAQKALKVKGIDNNPDLIKEAGKLNTADNIKYVIHDLKHVNKLDLPEADGIWTSFVASYFPDFTPVLDKWLGILKPKGWIAIVEMSDLFAHIPLSNETIRIFCNYYRQQYELNIYDFKMGSKVNNFLINAGLKIIFEENMFDKELTFNGPADTQILTSWENRFDRMFKFRDYVGEDKFIKIKREFLNCLLDEHHKSETIVKFIIAKR